MRYARPGFPVLQRVRPELDRLERHVAVYGREPVDTGRPLRHMASVRRQHLSVCTLGAFELLSWGYLEWRGKLCIVYGKFRFKKKFYNLLMN